MDTSPIRVLHVDDDPSLLELTSELLESEDNRLVLETATSADKGLDQIGDRPPDCIVSDYDMPGKNGIEFLQAVRETHPDLPFILFTGKGSESVASDAMAAGVTDYLQKGSGTEQYELLANRITNAVQAQRATQEATRQEELMRLTEFAGDTGGWELDLETEELTLTDGTRRLINLSPDDSLGLEEAIDLYHPDDRDEVRAALDQAAETGEQVQGTWRVRPNEGEQRLLDVTVTPVRSNGDITTLRGAVNDITERYERRQELESERRFIKQSLNALDDLFYVLDTDGTIRQWNDRVIDVTGYTESELDGMDATEIFPEDEQEGIANAISQTLADGRGAAEADLQTADGDRIPYEWTGARLTDTDGTTTGIVGIGRDLSERRQRERRFRALVEESNDVISIIDADGRFQYQSPSLERILGYDPEEMVGGLAWEYIHPDDCVAVMDTFEEWLTSPESRESVEYRAHHADGSWRWFEARASKQFDNPAVEGYVVNSRDVTERKQREQELERTQDLMANMEQLADAGAWEYDSGTDSLMITDGTRRLYGHDPDTDLSLEAALDAVHPGDRDLLRDRFNNCLETGEPYEIDIRLTTRDGGQRWLTARGERVTTDGNSSVVRGYIQDITEQTEQQQELEHRTDLFEKAQQIADVGAWAYDIERGTLTWTDKVYDIHGVSKDFDPSLDDAKELYHPEDQPKLSEAVNQAVTAGEPYDLEVRITARDDRTRWIRAVADPQTEDGDVVRVRGTVHDITDRKQRERELRQYEHFFKNSPDQIALLNEDLTVQYQSPPSSLHELDAIEVEGDNPLEYVHPDDRQTLSNHFEESLRNPGESFSEEFRAKDVSGEWRWVETRAINLLNEEPADGILVMIRDVTQKKRRQLERERQNERLEEFASVVSHDLRNPLRTAGGRLELAQADCDSTHLDNIGDALNRMDALIEDLLTLAQSGETVGNTEAVSLSSLIEKCWEVVPSENAALTVETDQTISADRSRLQQLLENLFANAVEHGGKDVTVRVGDLKEGFYVADDGVGIPEGEREDIFEAGYSTAEEGTGFGLRIAKQIVDAHGWDIRVTDSDDDGAQFEITGIDTPE
ncbi:PAS domain S-box protein [Halovenus salina]|uniref:PAS domain S-box protein n=1 Tax=Halovenus salina TaxID=1510225 RepID=UPI002260A2F2|nr:PAS domain S-box protein [Halovenus salina]